MYKYNERTIEYSKHLTVKVYHEVDYYPETDYLGEFSNSWTPGAIHIAAEDKYRGVYSHREPSYFIPAISIESERKTLRKMGYSRHEAYTIANKQACAAYERFMDYNDSWNFMIVTAEVWYKNTMIGSASVAGVESDSDHDFMELIEADQIMEALHDSTFYVDSHTVTAKRKMAAQYETLARKSHLDSHTSRWSKCPKQSGYAAWYTKNVQGE